MPRPFTLNNNDRKVRMVSVYFYLVWGENRTFGERKRKTGDNGSREKEMLEGECSEKYQN